jgi:hypothetical protein
LKKKFGVDVVLTRVVTVEEEVDTATATPTNLPADTPTPEALNITRLFEDALDDCLLSDGQSTECAGYDIDAVLWGFAQNDVDLSMINLEAKEAGFVPLETPIAISYPFLFVGIRINNIDPAAAYYCIYYTHQQPTTTHSDPTANVLSTCYNHQYDFLYANLHGTSGQPEVNADPQGTQISFDLGIGMTFGQEWEIIFDPFPEGSADVLGFTNEGSEWDKLRVDLDAFLTEQQIGPD